MERSKRNARREATAVSKNSKPTDREDNINVDNSITIFDEWTIRENELINGVTFEAFCQAINGNASQH